MHGFEQSTLDTSETSGAPSSAQYIGAAIQCHPDLRRVGEVARLFDVEGEGALSLSRSDPWFRDVRAQRTAPLATARVSRLPIGLRLLADGALIIDVPKGVAAFIGDDPIEGPRTCSAAELAAGVLLRLGSYVLLRLGVYGGETEGCDEMPQLIGQSAAMQRLRREVMRVAHLDVPVMLRGETGVGKELVASALHALSRRRAGPYVCVNMAAIPPSMAASELFGHGKGAFTGASAGRAGYFADADGGTLFLDEMGDTGSEVQPVLLRAIETGVIQPLGGKLRNVDVRLIAATDSNLEAAVDAGRFHGALLRRFEYDIWIPPLRERSEDVPELFSHFLREALDAFDEKRSEKPGEEPAPFLPAEFMLRLCAHDWPGNVRELRALARRVAIDSQGQDRARIDERVLSMLKPDEVRRAPRPSAAPGKRRAEELTPQEIVDALRRNAFTINPTAIDLGVSRSWLHERMNTLVEVRKARDLTREEVEQAMEKCNGDLNAAAAMLEVSPRGLQLRISQLGLSRGAGQHE